MASPDISRYVDLTVLDPESQTIFLDALQYARFALPEFEPREGSMEVVLLQAMALQVRQLAVAINRVPGAVLEVLLKLLDVERLTGSRATAYAKFVGNSTTTFRVPAGTRLYYIESQSTTPLLLETTSTTEVSHTKAVSSLSQSGTTITVVTTLMHGLSTGDSVSLSGFATSQLNVSNKTITVTNSTTFTLTGDDSATRSVTGSGTVTPASTIPATGYIPVQTATVDDTYNGLTVGTELKLLSVLPSVASVYMGTTLEGGQLEETDDDYFTRATATLSRLSTGIITASQAQSFVLDVNRFPSVYRAIASDNTTASRLEGITGRMIVAAAPVDSSSSNLLTGIGNGSVDSTSASYGDLDEIYDALSTRMHASLSMAVVHPAFVKVSVSATVALPDGGSAADSEAACETALTDYMSSNTWPWDPYVRVNEIVVLLRNATVTTGTLVSPATSYVSSVTLTPTDVYVPAATVIISTVTQSGTTITVTTSIPHGLTTGDYVSLSGLTPSALNVLNKSVTVVDEDTFTLTGDDSATRSTTGGLMTYSTGQNRFTISSISRSGTTVTITLAANHNITIDSGETLYLKIGDVNSTFNTTGVVAATSASGNQFVYTYGSGTASATGGYVIAAVKKMANGDLQILDPAPLVESDTHTVTVN